ncbi:MAG: T9SS type A sorting domain-containing protein, partial [Ignavibacteria bacterium]
SYVPSVSVSGSVVHIVWEDYRDVSPEVYYKRSTDGGISWGADTRLTNNPAISALPCVSVSGQVVHVVWYDYRDGNAEIYYKHSTDGGISWGADTRLTNNSANSYDPSVSVSGSVVQVVWYDFRDGNYEIYYKRSTDGGVSWGADTRLTNNSAFSENPSVAVSGTVVHVVWYDDRDGDYEIYYKRNPTGNSIGVININSEIPKEFKLEQNYPNPFNASTKFKIQISKLSDVKIIVYDALGQAVTTLVNEQLKPGTYEVELDASDFTSGVYYYTLTAETFKETKRMVLIK